MIVIWATDKRFEKYARKYGIHLASGETMDDELVETSFLVKSSDPLFEEIIEDQQYYDEDAWVEVPEED